MGCGPGFTTVPWKEAYPDAEVYGVDVGGPQVRYAHGRAESLGVPIHYSQQDATATDFLDGYFDIVVSMLVTHECPQPVIRGLFREAHRLLAPGGLTLHDGGASYASDPFENLLTSWFGNNANEPFSAGFKALDYDAAFLDAGFTRDELVRGTRDPGLSQGPAAADQLHRRPKASERAGIMRYRLGVDVGGTFTDLLLFDEGKRRLLAAQDAVDAGRQQRGHPDWGDRAVRDGRRIAD